MKVMTMLLRGMTAGLVATCILTVLILATRWLPHFKTIMLLDGIARGLAIDIGLPVPLAGWLWHFIVGGLLWGWVYAVIEPIIPAHRPWLKGLYFGLMVTLLAWLALLPMASAGAFNTELSWIQPVLSLAQHLVYGVTIAIVFDRLSSKKYSPAGR